MADTDTILDLGQDSQKRSRMDLEFQDLPHVHSPVHSSDEDPGKSQTHTFTSFPQQAAGDSEEDEDKTELLEKKPHSFWTFEYYQTFFDVETKQVLYRILGSMLPRPGSNYLRKQIRPNPDLYGPFWICVTLIFTTAISGNLASYFHVASRGEDFHWSYDFHKVTFAATAIFCYWLLVPSALYGFMWWRQSPAGYTFLEMVCVYGYSLAVYIPISILWVINYDWLHWLSVMLGMVLSGTVLLFVFWPAVREDKNPKAAWIIMVVIFLLHGLLAVGFVLYFFTFTESPSTTNTTVTPTTVTTMQNNIKITKELTDIAKTTVKSVLKKVSKSRT